MSVLPGDPLSLVGFFAVAATIGMLLFSDWPKAYMLGVSCIVLFGLQFGDIVLRGAPLGLAELAFIPAGFLGGDWWTVVTYAFVHMASLAEPMRSVMHLGGNLFILLTAGPALERRVGGGWFLIIYAAGGFAAAGAGLGLAYLGGGDEVLRLPTPVSPMVGASGAIFAVLTAFAVRHPQEKLPIPIILVVWLPAMTVLLIYLAMNVGFMFLDAGIAWYGHFAGFMAGMLVAMLPIGALREGDSKPLDVDTFQSLTTSKRGREAVERLAELDPGEEDVASAWMDVLAEEASCPVCGEDLERAGLSLKCPRGHSLDQAGKTEP